MSEKRKSPKPMSGKGKSSKFSKPDFPDETKLRKLIEKQFKLKESDINNENDEEESNFKEEENTDDSPSHGNDDDMSSDHNNSVDVHIDMDEDSSHHSDLTSSDGKSSNSIVDSESDYSYSD